MEGTTVVSEVAYLLDQLESLLSSGRRLPWGRQVLVDREVLQTSIDQIRHALPEEVRQAQWIIKERDRIIQEAGHEADILMSDAVSRVHQLAGDSEVVREAEGRARGIISQAESRAAEVRLGALSYADEVLAGLEVELDRLQSTIRHNRQSLQPPKVTNE